MPGPSNWPLAQQNQDSAFQGKDDTEEGTREHETAGKAPPTLRGWPHGLDPAAGPCDPDKRRYHQAEAGECGSGRDQVWFEDNAPVHLTASFFSALPMQKRFERLRLFRPRFPIPVAGLAGVHHLIRSLVPLASTGSPLQA